MDPITQPILEQSAVGVVALVPYIIRAAELVYKSVTDPKPIIDQHCTLSGHEKYYMDRTRYDHLCILRKALSGTDIIPHKWELKNGCPTHQSSFMANARKLKEHVNAVNGSDYPQKSMVVGLVSTIENLFQALYVSNKIWHAGVYEWRNYRTDGYEVMFFSDLALWLSVDLPLYDVKKPSTAILIQQWITYCEAVNKNVLIFRADNDSPNSPKRKLNDIIEDLKIVHANVERAIKSASFNDKIQLINTNFLSMAKNVFNVFYLLLQDVPHDELLVREFLKHADPQKGMIQDPDMERLVKYLMGAWITETFKRAGIVSNAYENKLPIDVNTIDLHLSTDFSGVRSLSSTGLWPFARADRTQAEGYLRQIAGLHRLLLNLYFVRDCILLGALVSKYRGNDWVYGEDTGMDVVTVFLDIISDASCKLDQGMNNFKDSFCGVEYVTYSERKDSLDSCCTKVEGIKMHTDLIHKDHLSNKAFIESIHAEVGMYTQQKNDTEGNLNKLIDSMHAYIINTDMPVAPELFTKLFANNSAHVPTSNVMNVARYSTQEGELIPEELTVIKYKEQSLPTYWKATKIIDSMSNGNLDPTLAKLVTSTLPKEPSESEYYSNTQRTIYKHFLAPSNAVVLWPEWTSFLWNTRNIVKFKVLYTHVNAIMTILYPYDRSKRRTLQPLEMVLIDILLYRVINDSFNENKYYNFSCEWHEPPFVAEVKGKYIEITLDKDWAIIAKQLLREQLQSTLDNYNGYQQKILDLTNKITLLQNEILEKNALLQDKEDIIASKEADIAVNEGIISSQEKEIIYSGVIRDKLQQDLNTAKFELIKLRCGKGVESSQQSNDEASSSNTLYARMFSSKKSSQSESNSAAANMNHVTESTDPVSCNI